MIEASWGRERWRLGNRVVLPYLGSIRKHILRIKEGFSDASPAADSSLNRRENIGLVAERHLDLKPRRCQP